MSKSASAPDHPLLQCKVCALLFALRKLPFKRVAALTLFLHLTGEFYPFSSYPMYSGLDDKADLVYVRTVPEGRPVPILAAYNVNSSRAKKIYQSEVDKRVRARGARRAEATPEEMAAAASYLLDFLVRRMSPGQREIYPSNGIELVRVVLTNEGGVFRRVETPLAAIAPGVEPPPSGSAGPAESGNASGEESE